MEISNKLSVILPGIIIGVILFQTIVVAPTVFKSLGGLASPFLRAIFPRLFLFVALFGFASCIEKVFSNNELSFGFISALVTVIFMLICFFSADDKQSKRRTKRWTVPWITFAECSVNFGRFGCKFLCCLYLTVSFRFFHASF